METGEKTFVLCSAVLICFWVCVGGSLAPKIIDPEVTSLWDIKSALGQPAVMKDWEPSAADPCAWRLIICSDNLVSELDSPDQNLSGKLSPSIGNLTNMQTLVLRNNSISGQIPSEIGRLAKLHELDFSYNCFSGEIPTEMSKMKSLQILRLSNNNLTGTIPSFFTDMTVLTFVDLSFNNLHGPVPKLPNKTFNIVGNPLICGNKHEKDCSVTRSTPSPLVSNIPRSSQPSKRPKSHKFIIAIGSSLGGPFLLLAGFIFFLCWRRRHNQQIFFDMNEQQHEEINLENLKKFHFKELQIATNNFSSRNLIGKGGSGNVYKGYLRDGTIVAVKRLINCDAFGGETQFETEVQMISLAVHRNLLRLQGFCVAATERLLVYPYMSNGSVASRLKAKPTLDWAARKKIALGAARGLLYLHEQCDPKIIHRDVKAANILLDEYYEAVVGDFGLAKLLDHRDSHVTTAVRGTAGHIAPEYLSTGQSSEKTDVFSFGILLLELISGQRALEFGKAAHQRGALLDWARKIQQEKKPEMLVDKDLHNNYDPIELEEMVRVALLCTQYLPDQRPKMSEVVLMLEGDGLAEKWEASQRAEASRGRGNEFSYSARYSTNDSSLLAEAMELSGPR